MKNVDRIMYLKHPLFLSFYLIRRTNNSTLLKRKDRDDFRLKIVVMNQVTISPLGGMFFLSKQIFSLKM
jgi:hypothetical protein